VGSRAVLAMVFMFGDAIFSFVPSE
jgi:hypothetical protein